MITSLNSPQPFFSAFQHPIQYPIRGFFYDNSDKGLSHFQQNRHRLLKAILYDLFLN